MPQETRKAILRERIIASFFNAAKFCRNVVEKYAMIIVAKQRAFTIELLQ
jgi:hypothetical protein